MYTIDTSTIWQCISSFFGLVGGALRLDPDVFRAVQTSPGANLLTLLILILAGVSVSLGQSVILFANKVTPRRFLMSLLLNGVLFAVGVLIWAAILLLVGRIVFRVQLPFDQMGREVSLAYAPLLLGFFVLLPYAGSFLKHAFEIWSFLAILVATEDGAAQRDEDAAVPLAQPLVDEVCRRGAGRPVVHPDVGHPLAER